MPAAQQSGPRKPLPAALCIQRSTVSAAAATTSTARRRRWGRRRACRSLTHSDSRRAGAAEALCGHNLVGGIGGRVEDQTVRVVPVVVVAGSNGTARTFLPADGPVLDIAGTAVDLVDIVGTSVAVEGPDECTAGAGVVRAEVLQDVRLARAGPRVHGEVGVAPSVKGAGEGDGSIFGLGEQSVRRSSGVASARSF